MTTAALLEDLSARGAVVKADGDRLRVTPPAAGLTDSDRDALRRHKGELLTLLAGSPAADTDTPCTALDPDPAGPDGQLHQAAKIHAGARVQIVSTGEQGRVVEVWGADDPGTVTDPVYVGRILVRLDGREYDTLLRREDVQGLDAGCTP